MCDPGADPTAKTVLLPASRFSKMILAPNMVEVRPLYGGVYRRGVDDATCCVLEKGPVPPTAICHACYVVMCSECTRHALTPEDRDAFVKEVMHAQDPTQFKYILEKVACYYCARQTEESAFPSRVLTAAGVFLPYVRILRVGDIYEAAAARDEAASSLKRTTEFRMPEEVIARMRAISLQPADVEVLTGCAKCAALEPAELCEEHASPPYEGSGGVSPSFWDCPEDDVKVRLHQTPPSEQAHSQPLRPLLQAVTAALSEEAKEEPLLSQPPLPPAPHSE